jgi:hypothetical protein
VDATNRRRYSRLHVELELTWKARRAGESLNQPLQRARTRDLSAGGISFVTDEEGLEVGTYLAIMLYGPGDSDRAVPLQGVVTWVRRTAEGPIVGVRLLTAPEDGLHALMMEAHEFMGAAGCACAAVRYCGVLTEQCEAFKAGKSCWQMENVACCYWYGEGRDCTRCPVSILCFLD